MSTPSREIPEAVSDDFDESVFLALKNLAVVGARVHRGPMTEALRREFDYWNAEVEKLAKEDKVTVLDLQKFDLSDTGAFLNFPCLHHFSRSSHLRSLVVSTFLWTHQYEQITMEFLGTLFRRSRQTLQRIVIVSKAMRDCLATQARLQWIMARYRVPVDGITFFSELSPSHEWTPLRTFDRVPEMPNPISKPPDFFPARPSAVEVPERVLVEGSKVGEARGLRVNVAPLRKPTALERIQQSPYNSELDEGLREYWRNPTPGAHPLDSVHLYTREEADVLAVNCFDLSDEGLRMYEKLDDLWQCHRIRVIIVSSFERMTPHITYERFLAFLKGFPRLEEIVVRANTAEERVASHLALSPVLQPRPHPSIPDLEFAPLKLSFIEYTEI